MTNVSSDASDRYDESIDDELDEILDPRARHRLRSWLRGDRATDSLTMDDWAAVLRQARLVVRCDSPDDDRSVQYAVARNGHVLRRRRGADGAFRPTEVAFAGELLDDVRDDALVTSLAYATDSGFDR